MSADREMIRGVWMPEPVALQERQARRMKDDVVTEWSNWYPCRYKTIEYARAWAFSGIPHEWRSVNTADQLRETVAAAVAIKDVEIASLTLEVAHKAEYAATTSRAHESACHERDALKTENLALLKTMVELRAEVKLKDAQNASVMKALQDCASTCNGMHGGPSVPCSRDIARNAIAKLEASIRARSQG